jgi:hypothetical protein
MGSGLDEYWMNVRAENSKDRKLNSSVNAFVHFLVKLNVIKQHYYVTYYGKVSWDLACRDYVGRNWPITKI